MRAAAVAAALAGGLAACAPVDPPSPERAAEICAERAAAAAAETRWATRIRLPGGGVETRVRLGPLPDPAAVYADCMQRLAGAPPGAG